MATYCYSDVHAMTYFDCIPRDICVELVKFYPSEAHWVLKQVPAFGFIKCRKTEGPCVYAAKIGDLNLLQWCRANRVPWDDKVIESAALHGHPHILEYCYQNGLVFKNTAETLKCITKSEHVPVLRWLLDRGVCSIDTIYNKCLYGNHMLEKLSFLQQYKSPTSEQICIITDNAVDSNNLPALEWLYNNFRDQVEEQIQRTCHDVTTIDTIKWMYSKDIEVPESCLYDIIRGDNVDDLIWFDAHIADVDEQLNTELASDYDFGLCGTAVNYGCLNALKWLISKGITFNEVDVDELAISKDDPAMLEYLHSIGVDICYEPVFHLFYMSCHYNYIDSLKWFHENIRPMTEQDAEYAVEFASANVVEWFYSIGLLRDCKYKCEYGYPIEKLRVMDSIGILDKKIRGKYFSVDELAFLHSKGYELNYPEILKRALRAVKIDTIEWLLVNNLVSCDQSDVPVLCKEIEKVARITVKNRSDPYFHDPDTETVYELRVLFALKTRLTRGLLKRRI